MTPHAHAGNNAAFTGPPDPDCFICRSVGKRTTGSIVVDLRGLARFYGGTAPSRTLTEAADRLDELTVMLAAAESRASRRLRTIKRSSDEDS